MTIDQTSSWTSRGETPSGASGWIKLRMTCLVRACPSDRGHGATPAQDQTPSSQSAPPPRGSPSWTKAENVESHVPNRPSDTFTSAKHTKTAREKKKIPEHIKIRDFYLPWGGPVSIRSEATSEQLEKPDMTFVFKISAEGTRA